jgi:hypothetical protein
VGTIANHGVAAIAEDANNTPLEQVLPDVRGVREGALIRPHDGTTGTGDLDPAIYDWREPAARITIIPAH